MWFYNSVIFLMGVCFLVRAQKSIGDPCHHADTSTAGECILINDCESALSEIHERKHPQLCGFEGTIPIVCCIDNIPKIQNSTPEDSVVKFDHKPGDIADQKCWEYSEAVYIQIPSVVALIERETLNVSTCTLTTQTLVIGGEDAKDEEFPHMALVGFGTDNNKTWDCGGTLISEQFVLSAAHCINTRNGVAKYIRLGELNLARTDDADPQDFDIIQTIIHPMYDFPAKYNDIGLLKMDHPTKFNEFIRPACLHLTTDISKNRYIATGWGTTKISKRSDHLQKVIIEYFSYDQCEVLYEKNKKELPGGIISESQFCAGGKDEEKDTCQGDSGGPLQIYHPRAHCMYSIVGITSFGKGCGTFNIPGVYTRVSHYIDWIEQNVWSDE